MSVSLRLLLLVNESAYFLSHRLNIARAAVDAGFDVHVVTRLTHDASRIERHGVTVHHVDFPRAARNPVVELRTVNRLIDIYRSVRPDIIHHFSAKGVLLGAMAASRIGASHVVNTFTGLGSVFSGRGLRASVKRRVAGYCLRRALRSKNWRVTFQNREDMDQLVGARIVSESQCKIIRGSGVDPLAFRPAGDVDDTLTVMFASRMIWPKGVAAFVDSARMLRSRGVSARFVLAGTSDPQNPACVPPTQLCEWHASGIVQWWGHCRDMPATLARADIVVLPTYYGEGLPKILLEAAACGKPIVATNVRGCREIVSDGENGYLVPPDDPSALSNAVRDLLDDPMKRHRMGINGRQLVLREFTADQVAAQTMAVYREMGFAFPVYQPRRVAA